MAVPRQGNNERLKPPMTASTDRDPAAHRPLDPQDPQDATGRLAGEVSSRDDVLTIAQEQAHISVERRETGGVRVRVVTDEGPVMYPVALEAETVEVTRHPVEREVEAVPDLREEGDVTIIPVVEERAVLVTKLFVVEEIHIRRTRITETVDVPVTLRRQRAVVEQLEPGAAGPDPAEG